ncbi:MAG: hypothetical protein VX768_14900 [Planctomycetota bacterium]|nr:hypothetical protein [Planctomycetota bacterium]
MTAQIKLPRFQFGSKKPMPGKPAGKKSVHLANQPANITMRQRGDGSTRIINRPAPSGQLRVQAASAALHSRPGMEPIQHAYYEKPDRETLSPAGPPSSIRSSFNQKEANAIVTELQAQLNQGEPPSPVSYRLTDAVAQREIGMVSRQKQRLQALSSPDNGSSKRFSNTIGAKLDNQLVSPPQAVTASERVLMQSDEIDRLTLLVQQLQTEKSTLQKELRLTVAALNQTNFALSESESQIISLNEENLLLKDKFRTLAQEYSRSETEVENLLKQLRDFVVQELRAVPAPVLEKNIPRLRATQPETIMLPSNGANSVNSRQGPVSGTEQLPSPKQ